MPKLVDLRVKLYNLDDSQIKWVNDTLKSMTVEEKIGQLFFNLFFFGEDKFTKNALMKR